MDYNNEGTGQALFCRKCGRRLVPDSVFCDRCGTRAALSGEIGRKGQAAAPQEPPAGVSATPGAGGWHRETNGEVRGHKTKSAGTGPVPERESRAVYPERGSEPGGAGATPGRESKAVYPDSGAESAGAGVASGRESRGNGGSSSQKKVIFLVVGVVVVLVLAALVLVWILLSNPGAEDGPDPSGQDAVVSDPRNPNARFPFTFDGPAFDPCDFLGDETIYDKDILDLLDGLVPDEDYRETRTTRNGGRAYNYSLFPSFPYLDLYAGDTTIEIRVAGENDRIWAIGYGFKVMKGTALQQIRGMVDSLSEVFGPYAECSYTRSGLHADPPYLEEMYEKIGDRDRGFYSVHWIANGRKITLAVTVDPRDISYLGSVTFEKA